MAKNLLNARLCKHPQDKDGRLLTGNFRLADGEGLYLQGRLQTNADGKQVQSKSWVHRFRFGGKVQEKGLGNLDRIGLATARYLRDQDNERVAKGINPIAARGDQQRDAEAAMDKETPFRKYAERWMKQKEDFGQWHSLQTPKQVRAHFERRVYKKLGSYPIKVFNYRTNKNAAKLVASVFLEVDELDKKSGTPFWKSKHPTAKYIAQNIRDVLKLAYANGDIDTWAAGDFEDGPLKELLPHLDYQPEHDKAMPVKDMPEFMVKLRAPVGGQHRTPHPTPKTVERCKRIVELKALNWSQNAIAKELKITPSKVSKLLAHIRKEKAPPKIYPRRPGAELLLFTIYTTARVGQCAGMLWSELKDRDDPTMPWDGIKDKALWITPHHKTQSSVKKDHVVVLNTQTIALIKERKARQLEAGTVSDFVFTQDNDGRQLCANAADNFLRGPLGVGREEASVHGFRTTMETWAGEHGYPTLDIELQQGRGLGDQNEYDLAKLQSPTGAGAIYFRQVERIESRERLMQHWGDTIDGKRPLWPEVAPKEEEQKPKLRLVQAAT